MSGVQPDITVLWTATIASHLWWFKTHWSANLELTSDQVRCTSARARLSSTPDAVLLHLVLIRARVSTPKSSPTSSDLPTTPPPPATLPLDLGTLQGLITDTPYISSVYQVDLLVLCWDFDLCKPHSSRPPMWSKHFRTSGVRCIMGGYRSGLLNRQSPSPFGAQCQDLLVIELPSHILTCRFDVFPHYLSCPSSASHRLTHSLGFANKINS